MATGKKDGDREAELEVAIEKVRGKTWKNVAKAETCHCAPPSKIEALGGQMPTFKDTIMFKADRSPGSATLLRALEGAVHAIRIKAAARRAVLVGKVDDAQDFLGRAREGDAIFCRGYDIGLSLDADALILVFGSIHLVARIGERIRGLPGLFTHAVELGSCHTHVVGFDRENAGCGFDELLLLDKRCRARIGGDANILEQHAAQKEGHVVGEGVEIFGEACRLGGSLESGVEIDGRTRDCLVAQYTQARRARKLGAECGSQLLAEIYEIHANLCEQSARLRQQTRR
jgi:hypothetical protein